MVDLDSSLELSCESARWVSMSDICLLFEVLSCTINFPGVRLDDMLAVEIELLRYMTKTSNANFVGLKLGLTVITILFAHFTVYKEKPEMTDLQYSENEELVLHFS